MDLVARSPIQVPLIHVQVRVESIPWTNEVYNITSYVTPKPEKTRQGKQSQEVLLSVDQRDPAGM